MKIVFIIYGISWLILLVVYISSLISKKKKSSEKEPWYLYALIIALAPLDVWLIPYLLISSYITDKKRKKSAKERERREAEERAYKQCAMQELKAAMNKPQENHSLVHAKTAQTLVERIKEKDYNSLMHYLDHLSLPVGVSLHVEECSHKGSGDVSKLFVQTSDGSKDLNIWNYIKADKTIDGAWDAYFLSKVWHILPLWWHANYSRRTYLYSKEDIENIHFFPGTEEESSLINRNIKTLINTPEVLESDGKFYVRCCYWSHFGGLIKESVEVLISPEGKVSINDIESKTLYKYACGVMF